MAGVGRDSPAKAESNGEGMLRIDISVFEALSGRDADDPGIVRWFDCWQR